MEEVVTKGRYEFEVWLSAHWVGNSISERITVEELGYTRKQWDTLSEEEKTKELEDHSRDWMQNHVAYGWK